MNTRVIRIRTLFGLLILSGALNVSAQKFNNYETTDIEFIAIENDPFASGGKYLAVKDSGSVVWTVNAPESGSGIVTSPGSCLCPQCFYGRLPDTIGAILE